MTKFNRLLLQYTVVATFQPFFNCYRFSCLYYAYREFSTTLAMVAIDKIHTCPSIYTWLWQTFIDVSLTVESEKSSGAQAAIAIQTILQREGEVRVPPAEAAKG